VLALLVGLSLILPAHAGSREAEMLDATAGRDRGRMRSFQHDYPQGRPTRDGRCTYYPERNAQGSIYRGPSIRAGDPTYWVEARGAGLADVYTSNHVFPESTRMGTIDCR
jgi:hypothetical protein